MNGRNKREELRKTEGIGRRMIDLFGGGEEKGEHQKECCRINSSETKKTPHPHPEVCSPIIYNILSFGVLGNHDILSGFPAVCGCSIIP